MAEIVSTNGKTIIVDDEDLAKLRQFKWLVCGWGYAMRRHLKRSIYMHKLLMNAPAGLRVDHINQNPLDNRKANLRICTHAENSRNSRARGRGYSKYRGVTWMPNRAKPWLAQIKFNYKRYYLGYFATEEEAAAAYDAAAIKYFGEFACPNKKAD